jgi:hypothetical protein
MGNEATVDSKRRQLLLSISHYKEALRIFTKVFGPIQQRAVDAAFYLATVSDELSSL